MFASGKRILTLLAVCLLLPCSLHATSQQLETRPAETAASAPEPFARVVVIGASVSAGYGLQLDLKARVQLGDIVDCMLKGDSEGCLDLGSNMLFRSPASVGDTQVSKALEHKPTLVIALDFLFWFVYGSNGGSTEERIERLDLGLSLLDRFKCPILVGDIPNMAMALKGEGPFGFPLITRRMMPPEEARLTINKHLAQWANSRSRVTIAPLSTFLESVQAGKILAVRGNKWDEADLAAMLQKDLLHPRPLGALSLLILAFDRLALSIPEASDRICWDRDEVYGRLLEKTSEERGRYEAAVRRRAERKAERDRKREDKHLPSMSL
jgi:hypothetical protein